MINHLNLVYFITAARELNFTRAAEKLFISQQALSNHIASLEKDVGISLIDRKTPMKLTAAGEIFYKYAIQMEDSYQAMLQEINEVKEEKRGELTIGISHTRGRLILPKVLPEFMEQYPLIEVHILEGNTRELWEALRDETIDMAVGPCTEDAKDMVFTELAEEDVVLAISEDLFKKLPKEKADYIRNTLIQTGKISCLKDMSFLLNKEGNISRDVADEIFKEENMKPHTVVGTENIETVGEMCAAGIGVAFYPTSLLHTLLMDNSLGELQLFRLKYPWTHMEVSVVYRKGKYVTKAMHELIQIMKKEVRKQYDPSTIKIL